MFGIGWSEYLLIGVVALIVIGPKELPTVMRTMGQWMAKIRRMSAEFQGQIQEALREAELADLKKTVDDTVRTISKPIDPAEFIDRFEQKSESKLETKSDTKSEIKPAETLASGATPEPPTVEPSLPEPTSEAAKRATVESPSPALSAPDHKP